MFEEVDFDLELGLNAHVTPGLCLGLFSLKAFKREFVKFGEMKTVLYGNESCITMGGKPAMWLIEKNGMYFVRAKQAAHTIDVVLTDIEPEQDAQEGTIEEQKCTSETRRVTQAIIVADLKPLAKTPRHIHNHTQQASSHSA